MAVDRTTEVEIIRLSIPSRLELLALVDQLADGICHRLSFSDEECSRVSISVLEAGTNAIQHGNRTDSTKAVDLSFEIHHDRLEVEVHDLGPGFNLDSVGSWDITSPEHILDARGRGIYLMRSCMDRVQYSFGPQGTTVRMMKARSPSANGARSSE